MIVRRKSGLKCEFVATDQPIKETLEGMASPFRGIKEGACWPRQL